MRKETQPNGNLISLRICEGIVDVENERTLRIRGLSHRLGLAEVKTKFMENFPVYMAHSMKLAGFRNLCPRISESTLQRNERLRLWGPHSVFTLLRYKREDLTPFTHQGNIGNAMEGRGLAQIAGQTQSRSRMNSIVGCLLLIRRYRTDREVMQRQARVLLESNNTEALRGLFVRRRSLARKCWANEVLEELILDYVDTVRTQHTEIGLNG